MLSVSERLFNRVLLFLAVLSVALTIGLIAVHWQTLLAHFKLGNTEMLASLKSDMSAALKMNFNFRRELFHIIIGACLTALFVVIYLSKGRIYRGEKLWFGSWMVSLVFTVSIVAVCYLATVYADNHDMDLIINRKEDVEKFEKEHREQSQKAGDPASIYVPTGMFIQSIEFTGSNNCVLTGYVWQRYNKNDTTIGRGFLIPEAQELEISEAYHKFYGDTELIGWNIKATVREIFDFSHYPFDHQNLWIRLWHKEFEKNIMLIPDLEAYPDYDPVNLPGIEKQIVMPGWHIYSAFFGYKFNDYNSNFGMPDYVGMKDFPEMYYNIFIQRDFISIFISDLVPVIMVVIIIFVALMITYKEDSQADFFEFNVMEVLGIIATLIFVVILAQIELRDKIMTDSILYIEYYYFVVYIALFGVLANYLVFHKGWEVPLVTHRNNYIPKILFLPLFTMLIFIVTVVIFY